MCYAGLCLYASSSVRPLPTANCHSCRVFRGREWVLVGGHTNPAHNAPCPLFTSRPHPYTSCSSFRTFRQRVPALLSEQKTYAREDRLLCLYCLRFQRK
ncbi:hypothetical protein CEXT_16091 [Caerostris extrusa]|uniref:Secreted protein n=1 Tax=Caerostris extrusa TaxID=172846 RepID=A0AAV4VCJ8_CAEEX|nr:hypothetical protein CEXT_16091 [Caerostris extrusa]